ncbi:12617_t:CDS:2 [Ambispora gerdemannii]|uniref:12617_t:CDS:1 n=1 Tax=Ambispora gerdemannii TaxID=144530 RepID=A0A9N8VTH5_9GLOM|nr:12617_t:CDS:2 [Ambispora gerdemannii]
MTTTPQAHNSQEENSVSLEAEIQSLESSSDAPSNNFSNVSEHIETSSNIQLFSPALSDNLEEISTASLLQIPTMEQVKPSSFEKNKDTANNSATLKDVSPKQGSPSANNQRQTTPTFSADNIPIKSSSTTQTLDSNIELHSPLITPDSNIELHSPSITPLDNKLDNISNKTSASTSPKKIGVIIDVQELKESGKNKNEVASTNDSKQEIQVSSAHEAVADSRTLQNSGMSKFAINEAIGSNQERDNKVDISSNNKTVEKQKIPSTSHSRLVAEASSSTNNAEAIVTVPNTHGLPAACLFVASLSTNKPDVQLQKAVLEHFTKWGAVMNVKVLKDPQQRPYAFVQYENVTDAKKALIQAHNTQIEGRLIRVEQARVNRTLFLGRLNKNFKEESLRQNAAYITEWATNIERAVPRPEDIDNFSIFVGWLNENLVTSDILKQRFEKYGEIDDLNLINRQSARNSELRPAFAFIKYKDEASVKEAIKNENNLLFLGRNIRVEQKESPEFRQLKSELLRQQQLMRNRSLQNYTGMTNPPPIHYQPLTSSASTRRQFTASPKKSNTKQKKSDTNQQVGSLQQRQLVDIDKEIFSSRKKEKEKSQAANKSCRESDKATEDKSLPNRKQQQQQSQSNSVTTTPFGPPPLMNQQPNYMPEASTMGMPWVTHDGTTHEMFYYAAPFIQTPEGPIYPYAPPMSFMGNPTLTTSFPPIPYYNSDFYHETPALVPQPTHLPPMNFHEYMAPVLPGLRDSLFGPQENENKASKVITPLANAAPVVNNSNVTNFQTSAGFSSTFQEPFANNSTAADAQLSETSVFRRDSVSIELSTTAAAATGNDAVSNSGMICHNETVELTTNTSLFPQSIGAGHGSQQ